MQKIKNLAERNPLLAYFVIYSLGALGITQTISELVGAAIFLPIGTFIQYTDWAIFSATPTKPVELLQYVFSVVVLAIYYAIAFVTLRYVGRREEIESLGFKKQWLIVYLALSLFVNLALLKIHGRFAPPLVGIWLVGFLFPAGHLLNRALEHFSRGRGRWMSVAIGVVLFIIGTCFFPYLTGRLPVSNDYFDVPEKTILSTGVVDNTTYINQNRIGGLLKYDPRMIDRLALPHDRGIVLSDSDAISALVLAHPAKYFYDKEKGLLFVLKDADASDIEALARIVSSSERERIYKYYSRQLKKETQQKDYGAEQIEFVKKNGSELFNQSLAGHYFHHQNTMLGTINEYVLGKPQNETVFLYGWLSTVVIAETMKLVGGVDIVTYQQVFYAFYPLYFLVFLVAAVLLFKRKDYVLLSVLLAASSLLMLGFENIRFAPGFSPIRHFFDVFVLAFFYLYHCKSDRKLLYFSLTLLFAFLSVLCNKEFGVVLLLSLLATTAVKAVSERRKLVGEFLLIFATLIALALVSPMMVTAKNPTLLYVLLGIAAPVANSVKIYGPLLLFAATYVLLWKGKNREGSWRYLALFYSLYIQGLLLYYIWNPTPNHLWSLGAVWGLLLVMLLKYSATNFEWVAQNEKKILCGANFLVLIFLFVPAAISYFLGQRDYGRTFENHVVHQWDFPKARITTTMEPEVFGNAIGLIQQYSTGNAIYILSKYDNFLPFLANKYSAMPYMEMGLSLVTQKEMDRSVNFIKTQRPKYLFVDTDMMRNHGGDVYDEDDPATIYLDTYMSSKGRAMVLDNFAKVFEKVRSLYEPVQIGQLITVYKRRES